MPLTKITGKIIKNQTFARNNIPSSITDGPYTGPVNLVPNPRFINRGITYPVNITGGGAYVADQVGWNYNGTGVTRTATYIDNITTYPTTGAGVGLYGEYFNNKTLTGTPVLSRTDATINFNWSNSSPMQVVNSDSFSVRWTGYVLPEFSDDYVFYVKSSDGARLWVNNQLIIDRWVDQATATERISTTITLVAGVRYDIKLEYYDNTGAASVELRWVCNMQPKQIIPASRLYPVDAFRVDSNLDVNTTTWMNFSQSGTSSGSTFNEIVFLMAEPRYIPDNYPITLSFYARSSVVGAKFEYIFYGVALASGNVSSIFATDLMLTPSWRRYTFTVNAPVLSGATRHSGSGWTTAGFTTITYPYLAFRLPRADGVVTMDVDISCVQLELGSVATPFEVLPTAVYENNLRHYYHILPENFNVYGWDNSTPATGIYKTLWFPATMRTNPSCSNNWSDVFRFGDGYVINITDERAQLKMTYSAVGTLGARYNAGNTINSRFY